MLETQSKLARLTECLDRHTLDAAIFWHRPNFAWLSAGRDNHVGRATPVGVAGLLAFKDRIVCFASSIETPRFRDEELAGLDIEVVSYPWWDIASARSIVRDVVGGARTACDHDQFQLGWPGLPTDVLRLRQTLLPEEMNRYRVGAALARDAIEEVAAKLSPGLTELDIAAQIEHAVRRRGASPTCVLVAADERLDTFRHPIPTSKKFSRVVMLVLGSEHRGLISSLSRVVHVGPISSELQRRLQAVADIDATAILGTRAGRRMNEVFADIQAAYARAGFTDEWRHHHQGGLTAYVGREVVANPSIDQAIEANQAFAWNPSVPGCKSEGTILLGDAGPEEITASNTFPSVEGHGAFGPLVRAGILRI